MNKTQHEKDSEAAAFEKWLHAQCPSGDVDEVQRKWETSHEYREWADAYYAEFPTLPNVAVSHAPATSRKPQP